MSQEKVDRYKKEKQKRMKGVKKASFKDNLWKFGMGAVLLVLVGWVLYSGYLKYDQISPRKYATVDLSEISTYTSSIKTIEDEEEKEEDTSENSEETQDTSSK